MKIHPSFFSENMFLEKDYKITIKRLI